MRKSKAMVSQRVGLMFGLALITAVSGICLEAAQRGQSSTSESVIQAGLAISPVPMNLAGKNRALVAEGSYIVNSGGCNDCHTNPPYVQGGDPFLGEPEQVNVAGFLAGGMAFGPFTSRNLTPDRNGFPAGLTFEQFVLVIRTGVDIDQDPPFVPSPSLDLLQVMPWPVFAKHTDRDLRAIYEYLRSIPCLEGTPDPDEPGPRC